MQKTNENGCLQPLFHVFLHESWWAPTTTVPGKSAEGAPYAAGGWPGTCAEKLQSLPIQHGNAGNIGNFNKEDIFHEKEQS